MDDLQRRLAKRERDLFVEIARHASIDRRLRRLAPDEPARSTPKDADVIPDVRVWSRPTWARRLSRRDRSAVLEGLGMVARWSPTHRP